MHPKRLDALRVAIFDIMRHTGPGDDGLPINTGGWLRAPDVAAAAGCSMAELVWVVYVTSPAMQGGRHVYLRSALWSFGSCF